MNIYYSMREKKNEEFVECFAILMAVMVVLVGFIALWQYVSPWAVVCVLVGNVSFVAGTWWGTR